MPGPPDGCSTAAPGRSSPSRDVELMPTLCRAHIQCLANAGEAYVLLLAHACDIIRHLDAGGGNRPRTSAELRQALAAAEQALSRQEPTRRQLRLDLCPTARP